MTPYIICMALVFICAMAAIIRQIRRPALVMAFFVLVAFAGLRNEIGWDYEVYQYFYDAVANLNITDLFASGSPSDLLGFEPGFALLIWSMAISGLNYQLVLAALTVGMCLYAAYRLMPEAIPIFLISYLLNGYYHNFSIVRQGLASAIVFVMFIVVGNHKRLWMYITASFVHFSAAFLAPTLFLCVRYSTKRILCGVLVLCWVLSATSTFGQILSFVLSVVGRERWQALLSIQQLTEKVGISFILVEYTIISLLLFIANEESRAVNFARGVLIYRLLTYGFLNDISIAWERTSSFADPLYAAAMAITILVTLKKIVPDKQVFQLGMVFATMALCMHVTIKYDRMLGTDARFEGERTHYERFIPYRSILDD